MDPIFATINRARALLAFMPPNEAALEMVTTGVSPEDAFFAIKAAQLLDLDDQE